jgi:orotate phosphoribosyltransferase
MNRFQLSEFISDKAIVKGEFTLNSGKRVNSYFDKYMLYTNPEAFYASVCELIHLLKDLDFNYIVAPELGGAMLATALQQKLYVDYDYVGLSIVREPKNHGNQQEITGGVVGAKVLIVEDVITSGKAVKNVIKTIVEMCYPSEIVQIVALVDRGGEGVKHLRGMGYKVSTVFSYEEFLLGDDD